MRIAFLALCCAGCLSTPPAASDGDGGPVDGSPFDAGPCERDPRPGQCNATGDFAPQPFPARPFELRVARVDDLNADGNADLLLASNAADNQGVFVLLGPVDVAAPQYHAFIDTDLDIGDLAIRNVIGPSGCPEITVFGSTGQAGGVQIWAYRGVANVMYDPTPLRPPPVEFVPNLTDDVSGAYLPVAVAWARVRPEGDDLLIGDHRHLHVIRIGGDFSAIARVSSEAVSNGAFPNFDSLNSVQAIPVGDCTLDGVLVTEGNRGHVLEGLGTLVAGPPIVTATAAGAVRHDVDGLPPDDVVISGGDRFAAYILNGDGGALSAVVHEGDTGYQALPDSDRLDGFAIGQLGGGAAPEWVAIDAPDGAATGVSRAVLIGDLAISGSAPDLELTGGASSTWFFSDGFIPRDVVIADLSDVVAGNQVWVIASNGELRCLIRNSSGTLVECL